MGIQNLDVLKEIEVNENDVTDNVEPEASETVDPSEVENDSAQDDSSAAPVPGTVSDPSSTSEVNSEETSETVEETPVSSDSEESPVVPDTEGVLENNSAEPKNAQVEHRASPKDVGAPE